MLSVELLERGSTIYSDIYCETMKMLRTIENNRRGNLDLNILFKFLKITNRTRPTALESSWMVYHLFQHINIATQSFYDDA